MSALDSRIRLTCDLNEAVRGADVIVVSISSQGLRGFMREVLACDVGSADFVLCMKGIEADTGSRLSEILVQSGVFARPHRRVGGTRAHSGVLRRGFPTAWSSIRRRRR